LDNKGRTPEEKAAEGEGGDMGVEMEDFGANDSDEEEGEEVFPRGRPVDVDPGDRVNEEADKFPQEVR
jgi:hypothetical protein